MFVTGDLESSIHPISMPGLEPIPLGERQGHTDTNETLLNPHFFFYMEEQTYYRHKNQRIRRDDEENSGVISVEK